ncbi:hypothetical protein LTR53_011388 [Teratosphaeriaceae sp. CCFEE 6253]|nr:hypothetical protein LTR53_011388 [Teratosphaeriaceae sp. CCFEE 6253]
MTTPTAPSRAIVASTPTPGQPPGHNWSLDPIFVPTTLKPGEVLIDMLATGICHTDLLVTSVPPPYITYPRIAGHEGAGYIRALGPDLAKEHLSVGDPVLLSYASCIECATCKLGRPYHCPKFGANIVGVADGFLSADGQEGIHGSFFGHSSFANLSVVKESSVVSAKDFVRDAQELKLFAPLGCGLQTGAGSVLNIAKAGKQDSVMVAGLGGIGDSQAAKIADSHEIIGIDVLESRVQRCKDFGASNSLDTKDIPDLVASFNSIANDGRGPDIFIDTTGVKAVQKAGYACLAHGGTLVFVGASPDPTQELVVDVRDMMARSVKVVGCLEGASNPGEVRNLVDKTAWSSLVKYYRESKFPIDRMTTFYKADDFQMALHDMHSGETIKAVLEW